MFPLLLAGAAAYGVYRAFNPGRDVAELFFKDHVKPVTGSVVSCRLGLVLDHTGIYVGNGRIIHRDGDGDICEVSPQGFLNRLGGFNPAISIFVSCYDESPVGGSAIAARARRALNRSSFEGYDFVSKNCHCFTNYCITGKKDNGIMDCTLLGVQNCMEEEYGMDNWRTWDWNDMERYG